MQFRTALSPQPARFQIRHSDCLMSVGSCFAEHIGRRLERNKFTTHLNPFGIIYNPISIADCLEWLLSENFFEEKHVFFHRQLWQSPLHHSSFSGLSSSATLEKMNQKLSESRIFLKKTNRLLLTFGTAQVFEDKKTQLVVANCHKLPSQHFEKKRLKVSDILQKIRPILGQLKATLPDLEIVVTVSPVRHLREGFVENQRSKAALLLALGELESELDFVHYFPAYELLLDDLRDYRFYDSDMLHPNPQAIEYIWQHFGSTFFDAPTLQLLQNISALQTATAHRPFQTETTDYQEFIKNTQQKIADLELQYPTLDFAQERNELDR